MSLFDGPTRHDSTLGVHVGSVTRLTGRAAWVRVTSGGRAPFEYGPCRVPDHIENAQTVTIDEAGWVTATPRPLQVGQTVTVRIGPDGAQILARYL